MKKALVISLYGNNNYGNKLQNYAVQELLKDYNIETEILKYKIKPKIDFINNLSLLKILSKIELKIKKIIIGKETINNRKINFERFNQNINYTNFVLKDVNEFQKIEKNYDYNIIGSDQIWGINISRIPQISFATFASKKKNIALSVSFGVESLPKNLTQRYINGIKNINFISVRENEGANIIKKITNQNAEVLLDPTMLIDEEKWNKIEKKPKGLKEKKYILTYFVEKSSKERNTKIMNLAKNNGWEVISLNDFNNKSFYTIGPSEFLYLIKHSEIIYTDSFHCAVFSILYEKDFYTLNRLDTNGKTNSRIKTLLNTFNLTNRSINNIADKIEKCDYVNKNKILKGEREKAKLFLEKALFSTEREAENEK